MSKYPGLKIAPVLSSFVFEFLSDEFDIRAKKFLNIVEEIMLKAPLYNV
jgi:hypothetical protein